jgi:hypothetical protein
MSREPRGEDALVAGADLDLAERPAVGLTGSSRPVRDPEPYLEEVPLASESTEQPARLGGGALLELELVSAQRDVGRQSDAERLRRGLHLLEVLGRQLVEVRDQGELTHGVAPGRVAHLVGELLEPRFSMLGEDRLPDRLELRVQMAELRSPTLDASGQSIYAMLGPHGSVHADPLRSEDLGGPELELTLPTQSFDVELQLPAADAGAGDALVPAERQIHRRRFVDRLSGGDRGGDVPAAHLLCARARGLPTDPPLDPVGLTEHLGGDGILEGDVPAVAGLADLLLEERVHPAAGEDAGLTRVGVQDLLRGAQRGRDKLRGGPRRSDDARVTEDVVDEPVGRLTLLRAETRRRLHEADAHRRP